MGAWVSMSGTAASKDGSMSSSSAADGTGKPLAEAGVSMKAEFFAPFVLKKELIGAWLLPYINASFSF